MRRHSTIAGFYQRLTDRLWRDPDKGAGPRRFALRALRLTFAVARDVVEGRFDDNAASLSYTTILSLAPLLALFFTVLKALGVHDVIVPFLHEFLHPLGKSSGDVTDHLAEFVDKIQPGVLGTVGTVFLLYGIVTMIQKIEKAFNGIWRVGETRGFFRLLRDYLIVLMIGPVLMLVSVAMSTLASHADAAIKLLHVDFTGTWVETAFDTVPYLLYMLAFAALYAMMPNTRVRLWPALVSGLITGALWRVLGTLFGLFVAGSASYAAIYSAFAALALLMVWIYAGWMTVLAGAAFCYYMQHPSNQPLPRRAAVLSPRFREKLALEICAEVGRAFYKKEKPPTLPQLAAHARMPSLAVEEVISDLVQLEILSETADEGTGFVPRRPFHATSVEAMLDAVRSAGEGGVLQAHRIASASDVNAVLKIRDKAVHKELGKITLKQLALGSAEI